MRLQFAHRWWHFQEPQLTASSSWWWIAVTHLFPFLQTLLLSLMPLIKGSLGFFLWHFWFPLSLKRFAPSSFSGCSCSCMKGVHLFRDVFKEAGCDPSFASPATSFLTCCFYFWPTLFQITLIGSQMLHIKTKGIYSSWEPLVPAVSSPAPVLLPHRHSTESFSA